MTKLVYIFLWIMFWYLALSIYLPPWPFTLVPLFIMGIGVSVALILPDDLEDPWA